jgi:hypothetical protein
MSVPRGTPVLPPADLATRALTDCLVPVSGEFFRISHENASLVDWSASDGARFSGPTLPCQVLYLAATKETCFWERFGEDLRDQPVDKRALGAKLLAERVWKTVAIAPEAPARCLDLRKVEMLRRLGADGGTFLAPYDVTQAWAAALMSHPAGIDGLVYSSRLNTPEQCLALFDRPRFTATPSPVSTSVLAVRPIDDPEMLAVLARSRIALLT